MGTLTDPNVALTVPWADMAVDQTPKPIARRSRVSRTPASITIARHPRAMADVAKRSPKYPMSQGAVGARTMMSPCCNCSIATWIIQLSPGGADMVTADPAIPKSC